jgi:tRNA U38,U39,U40 pseudouridine synthase TruA
MVRGLVGTMLQAGRGKISIDAFRKIIEDRDCTKANFAVPGHGLFLAKVNYPPGYPVTSYAAQKPISRSLLTSHYSPSCIPAG